MAGRECKVHHSGFKITHHQALHRRVKLASDLYDAERAVIKAATEAFKARERAGEPGRTILGPAASEERMLYEKVAETLRLREEVERSDEKAKKTT